MKTLRRSLPPNKRRLALRRGVALPHRRPHDEGRGRGVDVKSQYNVQWLPQHRGFSRFPPTSGERRDQLYSGLLQHLYKGKEEKEAAVAVAVGQALRAVRGVTRVVIGGAPAERG